MPASRWVPVVSVPCAVSVLSSCSGDDDKGSIDPTSTPSASTSAAAGANEATSRTCKVDVTVTGTVQVAWKGKGTAQTGGSGPKAIYLAEQDGAQLVAYAGGGDIPTSANFTKGEDTYSTASGDASGLELTRSGRGADMDADAAGVDPRSKVHITASFDC
jgi:hypothetical protein